MKYLVIEVRDSYFSMETYQILEDAQKAYEAAKKDTANYGVYLTAILKEVNL